MPDWSIAMGERKARFDQLAVDLIEEAELDSSGGIGPDSEVASAFGKGGAESSGVCWKHWVILPCPHQINGIRLSKKATGQ